MKDEIYDIFDRRGRRMGKATWTEVHTRGLIHKTSAILVFKNSARQKLLIQQRSKNMFHSPGTWVHSAGGHILSGKTPRDGVRKELQEEIFFGARVPDVPIRFVTRFFSHDLPHNYELLYVFDMMYPGPFSRGLKEVARLKWVDMNELIADMKRKPEKYGKVFHLVMKHYLAATRRRKRRG